MATARIEEVLPEPPPKKVILELTEDEAKFLRWLTGSAAKPVLNNEGISLNAEIWRALLGVTKDPGERRFRLS